MRHRRHRTTSALTALALLTLPLAACSSDDGGTIADGDCQLTFLASADRPTDEQDAWRQVFANFEEEYGCSVEARFQGTWDEITQQLTGARIADEQVNLFITSTATRDLARAGMVMDLSTCIAPFEDRFLPSAQAPYVIDGHVWAVPMSSTDTSAMIYNATLFDELGIDPPQTYADLVAAGEVIAENTDMVPIIHQGKSPWYWSMWYFATFGQRSGNDSVALTEAFLAGERQFTSAEEVAALADLARFTADGLMDRGTLDTDSDGMRATFLQQRAAMMFALTPELVNLRTAEPDFELGVFLFPLAEAGLSPEMGGGPENGVSVASFADPDTMAVSCQLIEFMSRPDQAAILFEPVNPLVPSVAGVPVTTAEPLADQLIAEFIPHTVTFLDWIWPGQINDAVRNAVVDVMYNGKDPALAAQDVQNALDTLVAEEDYSYRWWESWTDEQRAAVTFPADMTIDVAD